ncbi:sodium channel subunit beta-4-like isoform X1 [Pelobates fuscus]|uniref:sodium channel subunit beta-4-like isoform X1 n=1 Tax=Pelobates fuscus TaxID=191477 RepID=UPI002FE4AB90
MSGVFSGEFVLKPVLLLFLLQMLSLYQGQISACSMPESQGMTALLGSTILLPCNFLPDYPDYNTQVNNSIVWIRNESDYLVEITLSGISKFWRNHAASFETFPLMAAKGNFSLLLKNTRMEDAGSYHCKLFNGIDCIVENKATKLDVVHNLEGIQNRYMNTTFIIAVGVGCGSVIIIIIIVSSLVLYRARKKQHGQQRHQHSLETNECVDNSTAQSETRYNQIYKNIIYRH